MREDPIFKLVEGAVPGDQQYVSFCAAYIGQRSHQVCQAKDCTLPPHWVLTITLDEDDNAPYRFCHRHAIEKFCEFFGGAVVQMEVWGGKQTA